MLLIRYVILLFVTVISLRCEAQQQRINITPASHQIQYLSQDDREYFFDYVTKLDSDKWQVIDTNMPLSLSSHSYWLRFELSPPTSEAQDWFLEIANPLIDELDVYVAKENDFTLYQLGDMVKASQRPTPTRVFLTPLPRSDAPVIIYLKYHGTAGSSLPMALISYNEALADSTSLAFGFGLFIGLVILVLLAGGGAFVITKNKTYLYLCGYLFCASLMTSIGEGYASLVLWPNYPWLQNLISPSLSLITVWMLIHFSKEFLEFKQHLPENIYRVYNVLSKLLISTAAILLVLPATITAIVSLALLPISLLALAALVVVVHRQGTGVDKWYQISAAAFLLFLVIKMTVILSADMLIDLSQFNIFIYSLHILTMAIALIKVGYDQYILQQSQYIEMVDLAEQTAKLDRNILQEHQEEHHTLEALVDERTFELNVTLRELQETNRRLEEQATNDALTGAKNRKFFDQRVQAEYRLSRRQQTPISLLMLDIDFFKKINDTYGHLAGDNVLVEFTKSIKALLRRPNDYVCRYGGEEFAVLLSNTDQKGALKVAELIRSKIEQLVITVESTTINVTVSIGVSTLIINDSVSNEQLFSSADKALYQAKERGRNQVVGNENTES